MSRRNGGPKLDLKLNLSPPRGSRRIAQSPNRSASVSPSSTASCVSSEMSHALDSPESTSMLLLGCPRCLMYVMISDNDPKCPKCQSTVLLDFYNTGS